MHCMRHYFLRYLKVSPKWKISDSFFHQDHFELKVVLFFFLETTGNDWKLTKFSQRHVTNSWFFSSWGKSFIHFKISRSTFILWVIKFFVDFFSKGNFFHLWFTTSMICWSVMPKVSIRGWDSFRTGLQNRLYGFLTKIWLIACFVFRSHVITLSAILSHMDHHLNLQWANGPSNKNQSILNNWKSYH